MVRKKEGLSQVDVEEHLEGLKNSKGKMDYLAKVIKKENLLSPPTKKAVNRMYQKLLSKEPLIMAKNYEKAGMMIKAGEMYEKAGELLKAGSICEKNNRLTEASKDI